MNRANLNSYFVMLLLKVCDQYPEPADLALNKVKLSVIETN